MKKIFIFTFTFLFINSYSQNSTLETRNNVNEFKNLTNIGGWLPGKIEDKTIKGSVYLFPNWNGIHKVTTKNGEKIQLLNLNYNIKNKTLESYVSSDSVFQYDIDKFDFFLKSNLKYKVIEINNVKGLFQEIYYSPKLMLYKEPLISITSGVINPLTQEKMQQDSYELNFVYYLFVNNKFEKINLKKADLFKHFTKEKNLIKEFVSKNNLDYSDEVSFIKILNYLNTIVN